jgi:hypothetical protein
MTRWMLAGLLFAAPAFAASMNTYASQLGGTNLVQLIPGEFPLLTTTYAGTPLQSANSGVLIFETNVAPIGTFTLAYTLTIGGQQFSIPAATYSCTTSTGCFFPADFTLPTFLHPTAGTLTVDNSVSVTTFGFMFQSPVPEPTSVVLLGTGLAAIRWRRYRS